MGGITIAISKDKYAIVLNSFCLSFKLNQSIRTIKSVSKLINTDKTYGFKPVTIWCGRLNKTYPTKQLRIIIRINKMKGRFIVLAIYEGVETIPAKYRSAPNEFPA